MISGILEVLLGVGVWYVTFRRIIPARKAVAAESTARATAALLEWKALLDAVLKAQQEVERCTQNMLDEVTKAQTEKIRLDASVKEELELSQRVATDAMNRETRTRMALVSFMLHQGASQQQINDLLHVIEHPEQSEIGEKG